MKKEPKSDRSLDMKRYDWSQARRGRFAARFPKIPSKEPIAVRVLDDDLIDAFPDSESVNSALRSLLEVAKHIKATHRRPKHAA